MNRTKQFFSVFMLIAFVSVFLSCKNNKKKDPEKDKPSEEIVVKTVSPVVLFENDFAEAIFDNNDFRITKVYLSTGESIPMHSGISRIIYSLSDYDLKYESDTEGKLEKQFNSGDIHWHEACQHALENAGETEATFLVVSYKQSEI